MPYLLTFGDSNTHGTPPIVTRGEYHRFGPALRWPQVCWRDLGVGWELAEEGLPGRTAQFPDPVMGAHMNGQDGLKIALQSHGPVDVLTIMLGTNDVKARFSATPEAVTAGIAGLVDVAQSLEMQARHGGFKVLLICPPPVLEVGPISGEFLGGAARSQGLAARYRELAIARGIGFLDAGEIIAVSPQDGIHFEPQAHTTLGLAVAGVIRGL
ncbi:MAG: SGNH/GDSL hydrolase family protein [Pseudotabrizicola sp.]|uniref:SGNH/GDSL hydrolase family protein n=1 Tax=Pseudotabrizicola sp. TaxID=2939647 RepID=UPI00271D1950|nr:SGNH/GDSL hydrolase family protein [Pseudotabrizicola sp.]MDO8882614.1 SGNH/GDSL hydrolase family protein [Pseudotabrizicola sp.]MDP2081852.1 SGNH/GDSL hydrolase family protein [Pseudotabrizicola sp.]MDZ7573858.1 SGNH/GDSL hydrolase family protein [Pseudotabrizicola sp.]